MADTAGARCTTKKAGRVWLACFAALAATLISSAARFFQSLSLLYTNITKVRPLPNGDTTSGREEGVRASVHTARPPCVRKLDAYAAVSHGPRDGERAEEKGEERPESFYGNMCK